jgi:hypothetical protein
MTRTIMRLMLAIAALALIAVPATAATGAGLWSSTFQAGSTACPFNLTNTFCWIDDGGSVELGVKFTSSKAVNVVGVRAYRVDGGPVTGSLWATDGTRLAGPVAFDGTATHGWQDVTFGTPVAVTPGQTYIASYFAPNADYAFEHFFFTNGPYTTGPITALQSTVGDANGVYTYGGTSAFPTDSFRDSNYWVTPLWAYPFTGFHQPVDTALWNSAKAGSAIPVKFSLGGDQGLDVIKPGFPIARQIACPGGSVTTDAIEETVAASASGLTYDASADQYVYTWKTNKNWTGKCYRFDLGLDDDTSHTFDVSFR